MWFWARCDSALPLISFTTFPDLECRLPILQRKQYLCGTYRRPVGLHIPIRRNLKHISHFDSVLDRLFHPHRYIHITKHNFLTPMNANLLKDCYLIEDQCTPKGGHGFFVYSCMSDIVKYLQSGLSAYINYYISTPFFFILLSFSSPFFLNSSTT